MSAQGWQGSGFCRDATHVSPATAVPRALSPVSFETYIIPCVAWSWFYRTQERRDHAVIKPPRCGGRGVSARAGLGAGGWGGETPCTAQQKREARCPRCCRSHSCRWLGGWTGAFALNAIVVSSMAVGGLGFGGYRCAALTIAVPLYAAALPDPLTGQAPPHPPYHAHADGLPHPISPPASSVVALVDAVSSFGLFAKCYECGS